MRSIRARLVQVAKDFREMGELGHSESVSAALDRINANENERGN